MSFSNTAWKENKGIKSKILVLFLKYIEKLGFWEIGGGACSRVPGGG